MTGCRRIQPLLEVHVDGELSPEKALEVEQHLAECSVCPERLRLMWSVKQSTRHVVQSSAEARPAAELSVLRDRIAQAMAKERERERQNQLPARPLSWRGMAPLAAAAGIALALGVLGQGQNQSKSPGVAASNGSRGADAVGVDTQSIEELIDQLLEHHVKPPATQVVTEPDLLQGFEPEVGVPVHLPSLKQYGAHWVGGRVVPVRNRHAASLRYKVHGHNVTLYVYDSHRFPLRVELEPRVVDNEPVYVGTRRGYSIAAVEQRGLGYAVATDLAPLESAEIVASIH